MVDDQQRVVERIGAAITGAGVAPLPARVFAALLVHPHGRMTSAELVEALAVSPAAVSGAVRVLEQLGWTSRERERGSRRDVYVLQGDDWHHALLGSDQTYRPIEAALDAAVGIAHPEARARLVLSREFVVFVREEMVTMAERWDERRRRVEAELAQEDPRQVRR